MRLEPFPVLGLLRDLWSRPRDMSRFEVYLSRIRSGPGGEILLPLVAANPMAGPHMLECVERLEALEAEAILEQACAEASTRLCASAASVRLSLVPVDDVRGAWSDRTTLDYENRFGSDRLALRERGNPSHGPYATAHVYASETPTPQLLRERLLAAAYRFAHRHRHGHPATVRAMLVQEGRALRFAGHTHAPPEPAAEAAEALAPHLDATDPPTRLTTMYGDAAARHLGYAALGIPPNAGFLLALHAALRETQPPEAHV